MIDAMTSLAFSVYSSKGTYALLLGSGISRSAGVPTGWEIVADLIRRVTTLTGQQCGENPCAWYEAEYHKEPDYSELLEQLMPTAADRQALLRSYFEPTEAEREDEKKTPTEAHRAIAQLVAEGYIRVIVTTNFDRLLEIALQEAGVTASVISSPDDVQGAAPLAHSPCTIIKVHGDYRDSRLKNTTKELAAYDRVTNRLLRQVFDEYGLIVCGWSADWDVALRTAIERCPNHRYTMFWSAYRKLSEAAQDLCQMRAAQIVTGVDADDFFTSLAEKVDLLARLGAPHPLSAPLAVAAMKKYIPEERYRIKLHDLITQEVERAWPALFPNMRDTQKPPTLDQYERPLQLLLPMVMAAGYWGQPKQRSLWRRCLERIADTYNHRANLTWRSDSYPAYLLLHAYGIAAVAGRQIGSLAYILAKTQGGYLGGQKVELINHLCSQEFFNAMNAALYHTRPKDRSKIAYKNHIYETLQHPFSEWIPGIAQYHTCFVQYEYLHALAITSVTGMSGALEGIYVRADGLAEHFDRQIEQQKEKWPLLRAGFFQSSLQELKAAKQKFDLSRMKHSVGLE